MLTIDTQFIRNCDGYVNEKKCYIPYDSKDRRIYSAYPVSARSRERYSIFTTYSYDREGQLEPASVDNWITILN